MQNPEELKRQVLDLIAADQRYQAIRLIQNTYQVDEQKAQELLAAIERDQNQTSLGNPVGGCLSGGLRVVSILMAITGILFLAGLGLFYYTFEETKDTWVNSQGFVVSRTPFELDRDMFTLEIRYAYLDSTYEFTTATGYDQDQFTPGDSIPIWINPTEPQNAVVQDQGNVDIYWFLAIAAGVLFVIAFALWQFSRILRPKIS